MRVSQFLSLQSRLMGKARCHTLRSSVVGRRASIHDFTHPIPVANPEAHGPHHTNCNPCSRPACHRKEGSPWVAAEREGFAAAHFQRPLARWTRIRPRDRPPCIVDIGASFQPPRKRNATYGFTRVFVNPPSASTSKAYCRTNRSISLMVLHSTATSPHSSHPQVVNSPM